MLLHKIGKNIHLYHMYDYFNKLSAFIATEAQWTEQEQHSFFELLIPKKYKAGATLCKQGDNCNKVFFVNSGLLYNVTHSDNDKDFVTHFATENTFITDIIAFVTGSPAMSTIKAAEDTEYIIIPRQAIDWMYDNVKEGNKFFRKQFEYFYLSLAKRSRLNYMKDPQERYKLMLEMYPGIDRRVSQRLLSSFIRVDPAYFNRLGLIKNLHVNNTNNDEL